MSIMGTRSAPTVKFARHGDSIKGIIVGQVDERSQTDFVTKQVKLWDDGKPMLQWVVALQCDDEIDPPDDFGARTLYVKGGMVTPVRSAITSSGAADFEEGAELTVTYSGDAPPKAAGMKPSKQFQAFYVRPTGGYSEPPR
jgi:hypothetical protein